MGCVVALPLISACLCIGLSLLVLLNPYYLVEWGARIMEYNGRIEELKGVRQGRFTLLGVEAPVWQDVRSAKCNADRRDRSAFKNAKEI